MEKEVLKTLKAQRKIIIYIFFAVTLLIPINLPAEDAERVSMSPLLGSVYMKYDEPVACIGDSQGVLDAIKSEISYYLMTRPVQIKLVKSSCREHLYRCGNVDVEARLASEKTRYLMLYFHYNQMGADAGRCFERVFNVIDEYDLSEAGTALRDYKKRFPALYKNIRKGPLRWIDCGSKVTAAGISGMIHEVIHELNRYSKSRVVYYRPGKPPLEMNTSWEYDFGAEVLEDFLKAFKVAEKDARLFEIYSMVPLFLYFDEINAYTTSDGLNFKSLKTRREKEKQDDKLGPLGLFNLPAILSFVHYSLRKIQQEFAEEFPAHWKDISENETNKRTINMLWWEAVTLSNEIYAYLRRNKLRISPREEKYFKYVKSHSDSLLIP